MKHIWYNKNDEIAIRYLKYLRITAIDKVWRVKIQINKINISLFYIWMWT